MKILMFAHGGSLNRGCEAIVRSTTDIIKEKLNDVNIFLASQKPESDRHIEKLDGIVNASPKNIHKYSLEWFLSGLVLKLFKNESYALGKIEQETIKHIKDIDVFLSIGGDNYCYGEQPSWYEIDKRVKSKGKKLVLWGCSIGEEDISERKLEDLKLFDLILARETLTYEMLKNKGLKNVKLCADPAFLLEKEELALPNGWMDGNMLGLNFSPLVMNRNKESLNAIRALIDHILTVTNMSIALTPHVIEPENNDYEILSSLYEEYQNTGRVLLLPDNLNAIQYKGYISRMRFFIGARTHATIAAYSNSIPTMVLGYSVKSRGIAKDLFGEEKLVLGIHEISDKDKLISTFDGMLKEEGEIKEKLTQTIPKIQSMSYKSVEHLRELIN